MLCMWEGHHCRKKPERPLWRAAWGMSGTISRWEGLTTREQTWRYSELWNYVESARITWPLLTSIGVDAVLRHGCQSHTSSLHWAASSLHGEVHIISISPELCLLINILKYYQKSLYFHLFPDVLTQWHFQACWKWVWVTSPSIKTGGVIWRILRTFMKNFSGRWRSLWWLWPMMPVSFCKMTGDDLSFL